MNQFQHIALTCFSFLAIFSIQAQTDWKLEKSGKGITVYTREIPETPIKEFKAEIVIMANIDALVLALQQVEEHPEWMADIMVADVLNQEPEILQYNMHLPFPFKDRYVVMSSRAESDSISHRIYLERSDHPPGEVGDMVELEHVKGSWQFTKIDDHHTAVIYQFVTDPGGSVPNWLVNSFIVKSPYKTLENLRKRLE